MSEISDFWRAKTLAMRKVRKLYGVNCPECVTGRPKACPTILLPRQVCKIHNYRDPRPRSPDADWKNHLTEV